MTSSVHTGTLPPHESRILVVDDEPHIRATLTRALDLKGYRTEAASHGTEALAMIAREAYDLMVLDMHLPDLNGVEVMKQARELQPSLRVVVLTGKATLESAIAALKSEAVDYLIKPASIHDILDAVARALHARQQELRQEALLRMMGEAFEALRHPDAPSPELAHRPEALGGKVTGAPEAPLLAKSGQQQVGRLLLEHERRMVTITGEPPRTVMLTEGETAVLGGLMTQPNRVLSCRQLAQLAWGYDQDERSAQSLVRPYIFRLRTKLEVNPDTPTYIITVRGRGYRLSPE